MLADLCGDVEFTLINCLSATSDRLVVFRMFCMNEFKVVWTVSTLISALSATIVVHDYVATSERRSL